jgi:hypothetical protein
MRYVAVAVVSFCLGILATLSAQHRLIPNTVSAQVGPFSMGGPFPMVPPLNAAMPRVQPVSVSVDHQTVISDVAPTFVLDGLSVRNSVFANRRGIVFTYGGGAYNLENVVISGNVGLELVGAAANTARFLESLGLLKPPDSTGGGKTRLTVTVPAPAPQPAPPKNQPIFNKLRLASPLRGDISSQYDGAPK